MNLMETVSSNKRMVFIILGLIVLFIALAVVAGMVFHDKDALQEQVGGFLEAARGTPWALPLICALYVFGGIVFFPIVVLNLACAMVFGLWGVVYALVGAMLNTTIYFLLGRAMKDRFGKKVMSHPNMQKVDRGIQKSGVAGIVGIHMLPAPSFTMMNFGAGMTSVSFWIFFIGTFLAFLPGAIARGVVGESLGQLIMEPTQESYMYLAGGIVLWVVLIAGSHFILKIFQKGEPDAAQAG